jgi:hypothetical protein
MRSAPLVSGSRSVMPHPAWKRTQVQTDSGGVPIGFEHVFKCSETGALRRWGLEAMSGEVES